MITYSVLAYAAYLYVDTIKMHQGRNDVHLMQYSGAAMSQKLGVSILLSSLLPSHPLFPLSPPPSLTLLPIILSLPSFPFLGDLPSEAN